MLMLKVMCEMHDLMLKEVLLKGKWLLGGWRKCQCVNSTGPNAGVQCNTMRAQGWLSCGKHKKHYDGGANRCAVSEFVKKS